jgi:hypothetical protein
LIVFDRLLRPERSAAAFPLLYTLNFINFYIKEIRASLAIFQPCVRKNFWLALLRVQIHNFGRSTVTKRNHPTMELFNTRSVKITSFTGEKNINKWKLELIEALEVHKLDYYIKERIDLPDDEEEQIKWREKRLKVRMIIRDFIREVHDTLEANEWDSEVDRNPKALYNLILRMIPKGLEDVIQNLVIE